MNLLIVARTMFKATLEQDPTYRALLAWPGQPSVIRTFGEYVDASVPTPYVTIEHYAGGLSNSAQSEDSDSLWKIAIHTMQDEALALEGSEAIYNALHGQWPVEGLPFTVAAYHPIELKYPYFDTVNRQGHVLIRAGGIYSLRLAQLK